MLKIHSRILPNYCLLAQMFVDEELRFFFLVHNKLSQISEKRPRGNWSYLLVHQILFCWSNFLLNFMFLNEGLGKATGRKFWMVILVNLLVEMQYEIYFFFFQTKIKSSFEFF
jgi:hypothetical protein